jgi:polygalacturonase
LVPAGKWLTGAIHLKSNINLEVADGAELMFSSNRENYLPQVISRFQGMEYYNFSPLIYARDCQNIAISGKGRLIGNGQPWRDWSEIRSTIARIKLLEMVNNNIDSSERVFGEEDGLRPSFVQFVNCKNILVKDIHLEDGPMWTIHMIYSKNITINGVNVKTTGINGDGVVIDSSRNVLVENCFLHTSDDSISIKSGLEKDGWRVGKSAERIIIKNCKITEGHSGVAIGSEMSGGVSDVFIRNNRFVSVNEGIQIKSMIGRGGVVENIWAKSNDIEKAKRSVLITMDYDSRISSNSERLPVFRNIYIYDVYLKRSSNALVIEGMPDKDLIHDVYIKNVNGSSIRAAVKVKHARNIFLRNVNVSVKKLPVVDFLNSQNIDLRNFSCKKNINECVKINGDHPEEIFFRK